MSSVTVTSQSGPTIHQGDKWEATPEGYLFITAKEPRRDVAIYSPGSWISAELNTEDDHPAPTTEIKVIVGGTVGDLEKALSTVKRYGARQ